MGYKNTWQTGGSRQAQAPMRLPAHMDSTSAVLPVTLFYPAPLVPRCCCADALPPHQPLRGPMPRRPPAERGARPSAGAGLRTCGARLRAAGLRRGRAHRGAAAGHARAREGGAAWRAHCVCGDGQPVDAGAAAGTQRGVAGRGGPSCKPARLVKPWGTSARGSMLQRLPHATHSASAARASSCTFRAE